MSLFVLAARPGGLQAQQASPTASALSQNAGDIAKTRAEFEKTRAEVEKIKAELTKLGWETKSLEAENASINVDLPRWSVRQWSALSGVFGGIAGALATIAVWIFGRAHQRSQKRKLDQERQLDREKQTLDVLRDLGHESPRVQLAAASVLLQRIDAMAVRRQAAIGSEWRERLFARLAERAALSSEEKLDWHMLPRVLIAVMKEPRKAGADGSHAALCKYIADGLVGALMAVREEHWQPVGDSPLREWDWQHVNLTDVFWKRVDARGVDFFEACLRKASLREAYLEGAVFYGADLSGAVLKKAKLAKVNFTAANLEGADLSGADLENAILTDAKVAGAKCDEQTRWPLDFDRERAGVVLVGG